MAGDNNRARTLKFMELMQQCLPYRWQKYWDCGSRGFDILMILHDSKNPELSLEDRFLLALLARIWMNEESLPAELCRAVSATAQGREELLAHWLDERHGCQIGCTCVASGRAFTEELHPGSPARPKRR